MRSWRFRVGCRVLVFWTLILILSFLDAIVSIARCVLFRVAIVPLSIFAVFLIFPFRV